MPSEEVVKITDEIYHFYGSGTGILFGLPPHKRAIAEAIVTATLRCLSSYEYKIIEGEE